MNINMLLSSNKKITTTLTVGANNVVQYGFIRKNNVGRLEPDIPTILEFYVQLIGNGVLVVMLSNPSPTGKITFSIDNTNFTFNSTGTTFSREAQSPSEKSFVNTIMHNLEKQLSLMITY